MPISDLLNRWRETPQIDANIAEWRTFPAQAAQTEPLPADLAPILTNTLQQRGINALYSHQAAAWTASGEGEHVVVVTGTASGKSLCYNLPVLNRLTSQPESRALYLFPTKALARDQAAGVRQLGHSLFDVTSNNLAVAAYDGDTPSGVRPAIRKQARIVITNPDMVHTGILPHHPRWVDFFRQLQTVVIDEMHVYRGVFGSHVANVLRRLRRVANFYGATPQFILTSATIANPVELAEQLVEGPVRLINDDGAAKGTRHFMIYNPPVVDADLNLRRSALQESVRLGGDLFEHNIQTLVFGHSRRTVELLLRHLRERVVLPDADSTEQIRAYRSGYLSQQRREIEQGLRDGVVRTIAATSALELGIDIGGMDAVVMAGYPGTVARTWQQAGRAGRQAGESLAIVIASANPLDQFLAQHPEYFFDRSAERALINPDNLLILLQHLRCAAFELNFELDETFGNVPAHSVAEILNFLHENGELHQSGTKFFWMADQYPAQAVSLRSASPERVRLTVSEGPQAGQTIGEVDRASAPWMVHPNAIYLHEGQAYRVVDLNFDELLATLLPASGDVYTEPKRETTVTLIEQMDQQWVAGGAKAYGEILVTEEVTGYQIVQLFTHERLGSGEVSLPPSELHTVGYWLSLSESTVDRLRASGQWENDPNDYGANWQSQRNKARARDGYRCQMCGRAEQGRQHDVHHKMPFRQFDSYAQANQLDNLITLCRPCHRRAETAVKMRSGLSGLAAVLGHLAPLFLMCAPSDIAVHADPQSPLADGQPVVLLYELIPAGLGFSQRLFEIHTELLTSARDLINTCPCADGCPSCIGPAGALGQGGKALTLAILEQIA